MPFSFWNYFLVLPNDLSDNYVFIIRQVLKEAKQIAIFFGGFKKFLFLAG